MQSEKQKRGQRDVQRGEHSKGQGWSKGVSKRGNKGEAKIIGKGPTKTM